MHTNEQALPLTSDGLPEDFGPYLVYERLGTGGMAMVHRAKKRGVSGFEHIVALKRLLPHLAGDAESIESFVREAKLGSMLSHRNIAQLHDVGRVGEHYFIELEYVEGVSVTKLLRYSHRRRELPPLNSVLSLLAEVCDALEYAHTRVDEHGQLHGIVHRGVTPSKLMVARTGHVKVTGFGPPKAQSRPLHTQIERAKGKLGYMSPEALIGWDVGPSADVFSVGVIAHELLTGQPLFSAKTSDETMTRIDELEIPPPSELNPGVPRALDHLVLSALERDAARRLPTAGAFRRGLADVATAAGIRLSSSDLALWQARVAAGLPASDASSPSPKSRARALPTTPPAPPASEGQAWYSFEDDGSLGTGSAVLAEASGLGASAAPAVMTSPIMPRPRARSRRLAFTLAGLLIVLGGGWVAAQLFQGSPEGAVAPAAPSTPLPVQVKFIVHPADSVVAIGNKEVSHTSPFEIPVEPGVYSVAVSHPGYKRWTSQITLHDTGGQTINVALEPDAARVQLSSDPAGLPAQLDGQPLVHPTPIEFEVAPGQHHLEVVGAGGTWSQDFAAEAAETYVLHAVLSPAKRTANPSRGTSQTHERTSQRSSSSTPTRTASARDGMTEPEPRVAEPEPPSDLQLPVVTPPPARAEPAPKPETPPSPPSAAPPPRPSAPPLIPASALTKLSGQLPAIESNGSADVSAKICVV